MQLAVGAREEAVGGALPDDGKTEVGLVEQLLGRDSALMKTQFKASDKSVLLSDLVT